VLFKVVLIMTLVAVSLCGLAFPIWIFGIPGTDNQYAQGWYMGLNVILVYPIASSINYISYLLLHRRMSERSCQRWQLVVSSIALISLLIAIVRMYQAFSLILST